jgi:hypothetical protein
LSDSTITKGLTGLCESSGQEQVDSYPESSDWQVVTTQELDLGRVQNENQHGSLRGLFKQLRVLKLQTLEKSAIQRHDHFLSANYYCSTIK